MPARSIIRFVIGPLAGVVCLMPTGRAWAYRPFDGTDAAVADLNEVEIEFQPAGITRDGGSRTLNAAATVINYGFAKQWELVIEGQLSAPLGGGMGPAALTGSAVLLKHILKPGSLQGEQGLSIATEFGAVLPDSVGPGGAGFSWAGIVSQRWDWGSVHFNLQTSLTRDQHADVFVGTIVEGPAKWIVRPVAEVFYEDEFGKGETVSGLVGAIWQVNDKLAFDLGLREARTAGHALTELRAGLTVGFSVEPRRPAMH
jgi:hypothetical protein